jgi:hypothetical protein
MLKFLLIVSVLIYPLSTNAQSIAPCDVNGLAYETDEFSFLICEGSLDHQTAVDCTNKFAEEAEHFRKRSELAQAQAECLCRELNAAMEGSGRYNWLTGQCTVSP